METVPDGAGLPAALSLAALVHGDAVDRGGALYIAHPLRMVVRAIEQAKPIEVAIVAALHDVVEDTPTSLDKLRNLGFSSTVVLAVDAMTRRQQESYESYLIQIAGNAIARQVKLLDIADNADPARLAKLSRTDRTRLSRKYSEALEYLSIFEKD